MGINQYERMQMLIILLKDAIDQHPNCPHLPLDAVDKIDLALEIFEEEVELAASAYAKEY